MLLRECDDAVDEDRRRSHRGVTMVVEDPEVEHVAGAFDGLYELLDKIWPGEKSVMCLL